jgi:polysaccharide biosynthesis/export protein
VSGLFGQSTTQLRVDNPSVDYPLGPGDEISVHVLDLDEISDKPTRIDLHGDLRLPLAGEFHAEGLTTRQLQDQIVGRLKGILLNPVVTVSLAEFRDQPVTVMGAVNTPGVKVGDNPAYSVAEVEIYSLLHAQKPGENIPCRAHDVISAPPAEMIYILGEVLRPGGYEVKHSRTISILDAVALAGGTSPIAGSSHF